MMILNCDNNSANTKRAMDLELTGIAEEIIDNYNHLIIKRAIVKNKKDGWKHISFDYKDIS